jgi:hypothetical protein
VVFFSNTSISGITTISNNLVVTGTANISGVVYSNTGFSANNATLSGEANVASIIKVGSNAFINTSTLFIGNSSVNFTINSTALTIDTISAGGQLIVGNSSVKSTVTSLSISIYDTYIFTGLANTRYAVVSQVGNTGLAGSIYLSTAGKMYLKVATTGSNTDWPEVLGAA